MQCVKNSESLNIRKNPTNTKEKVLAWAGLARLEHSLQELQGLALEYSKEVLGTAMPG